MSRNKLNNRLKALKRLSVKLKKGGDPNHHIEARRQFNIKYGRGWREKLKTDEPINTSFFEKEQAKFGDFEQYM